MDQNFLITVLSSSAVGALVSFFAQPLLEFIKRKSEIAKIENERKYNEALILKNKKEDTYLTALEFLTRIRKGFDVSDADLSIAPKAFKEDIHKLNSIHLELSAKIRLFSTNEIFEVFSNLSKWSQCAYSQHRLFEESKANFILMCNYLSKLMQEDLGYISNFQREIAKIRCPRCRCIHDFDSPKCPKCKLKFDDLLKILNKNTSNTSRLFKIRKKRK